MIGPIELETFVAYRQIKYTYLFRYAPLDDIFQQETPNGITRPLTGLIARHQPVKASFECQPPMGGEDLAV